MQFTHMTTTITIFITFNLLLAGLTRDRQVLKASGDYRVGLRYSAKITTANTNAAPVAYALAA
jgi:hypothetical protein